ncbi:uncharacterized protein DUF4136 [Novosphingobium sp. PhB165]|uniref:DUF4136 domain-containing protein n=1 Tax=Novosphingobium sp. PhB165 TaxID=2485105 RepID=UPI001045DB1D|nr:DUF4136 domain-containing protein [Novosphingobium sp. PhB165]TCM19922.1 uncharacterized protein DUF4136 [Novosphingobium sp. PhB165]
MTRSARPLLAAVFLAGALALGGCAAQVGPVEVTRFIAPDAPALGSGVIRVDAGPGQDASSLEFRAYATAVEQELARIGFRQALPGEAASDPQVAVLTVERRVIQPGSSGSPVSVAGLGSTGTYGSGVGIGVGINLSGRPSDQVETRMQVMIRDRPGGRTLWEGRAAFTVSSKSPMAQTSLGAAKMAEALFKGFPGKSGETILVQ